MGVRIEDDDLDRVAPFGVLCDESLTVTRVGPSWRRLCEAFVGRPLFDVFEAVRPTGLSTIESVRRHRDAMLLLRLIPTGPRVRFQVVDVSEPSGVLLVGTPVVSSSEELERLGLSSADFSPIDQTPDLLVLRRGQERSLEDLRTLNSELQRSAGELRWTNRMLTRAEAQYRSLVELQPLVMYIDNLGSLPVADFISPRVETWLGFPVQRWMDEPGFFFDTVVHPDDRDRVWAAHLRAERDVTSFDEELRVLTVDGRTLWVRAVDSVVRDDEEGSSRRVGFMLDTTTAKEAELDLHDTMSRLTTLLAHMQSGVLVEDAHRHVVIANDYLFGLFRSQAQPQDLVGLPATAAVSQLVSATDDPVAFLRRTEDLLHRRWPATNQSLTLSDGRVLEFDFQPIVAAGQNLGALWMFRDATDRVHYQEALARARDEAIAASDAKTQFLASMSHEIRTPMHGVLATLDLLRTTGLDTEQRELVDVVNSSATTLVQIINDILDLQRVESGRIDLSVEPYSPSEVLQGVVDLLSSQARARGLELRSVVDPAMPLLVTGDPLRLRQVLVNLAGNAVKFTSTGSVTILATVAERRGGAAVVEFEVRDTGQGIPADRLSAIFDPFVQARTGNEGTGLGLAISDRLVALMGGHIHVASTVGEGSTFRFQLRLPEISDSAALEVDEVDDEPTVDIATVLVVDDSQASRNLVVRQLTRFGVAAVAVESGRDALDILDARRSIGLVLLDVDMPDLDGPETCARMRASDNPRIAGVPVIALLAGDHDDVFERCRASGMDGHLSKPVDLADLRRVVDEMLDRAVR
jgi:PAS domain S-box-containing protein